jgi:hypothetical protein
MAHLPSPPVTINITSSGTMHQPVTVIIKSPWQRPNTTDNESAVAEGDRGCGKSAVAGRDDGRGGGGGDIRGIDLANTLEWEEEWVFAYRHMHSSDQNKYHSNQDCKSLRYASMESGWYPAALILEEERCKHCWHDSSEWQRLNFHEWRLNLSDIKSAVTEGDGGCGKSAVAERDDGRGGGGGDIRGIEVRGTGIAGVAESGGLVKLYRSSKTRGKYHYYPDCPSLTHSDVEVVFLLAASQSLSEATTCKFCVRRNAKGK